ncbi:MAG: hypothetical protein R8M45_03870 [Ghiorsea sp.]
MYSFGNDAYFWTGVVEDRHDPLQLGRVRVRIVGHHTNQLKEVKDSSLGIPVKHLPWAHPLMPITSASMNGIGETPIGPVEGTWVCGFSRDGMACQSLVYMGTLTGIPTSAAETKLGFGDNELCSPIAGRPHRQSEPAETYPKAAHLNESDVNRLARNAKIAQTIVKTKRDTEDKGVATANTASPAWNEKTTPYAAKYPFNRVTESESGHIVERDDTPGAERTHDYHRSGTFEEVHPDGTKVTRIVKDNYEIIHGNDFVHIKGICNVTIDGNANLYVKGNVDQQIGGDVVENVAGTVTMTSKTVTQTITGDLTQNVSGNANISASGNAKISAGGNSDVTAGGNINVSGGGSGSIHSGGSMSITSGASISITAPSVSIN